MRIPPLRNVSDWLVSVIPGGSREGRRGTGGFFAAILAVYLVVWIARVDAFGRLDAASRVPVIAGAVVLYLGAVVPVLRRRAEGRGRYATRFRSNGAAVVGLVIIVAMMCAALLAPLIVGHDPTAFDNPAATRLETPSASHPLGTDRFGRDVWSRIVYGARVSLGISIVSVALATLIALLVGCVAGMAGGWIDDVLSRLIDAMLSFPRQLFVLTVVAFFTNSLPLLVAAIAATSWMRIARLVRGEILRLKEAEFATAAQATGASAWRLLYRHLLPNVAGPMVVASSLQVGAVILLEAYLSFLGLGVEPPAPSWGAMVFEARDALVTAWWVPLFPALTITAAVVAFNLLGDGLRDALDVRLPATRR